MRDEAYEALGRQAPSLARMVQDSPLLRKSLEERTSTAPIVIAGRKRSWPDATEFLKVRGCEIKGYLQFQDDSDPDGSWHQTHPIYNSQAEIPSEYDIVFAGKPKKIWFDKSPPAPQSFYWIEVPQKVQLDPEVCRRHIRDRAAEYGSVFEALEDEDSRVTFASIVRSRIEEEPGYLRIAKFSEYQHPQVKAEWGDVVIDGGALDGKTAIEFADAVGPSGRVLAFEPDPKNFVKAAASVGERFNVTTWSYGLWDRPQILQFSGDAGGSSAIGPDGEQQIAATSIDQILATHRLKRVDLIKLDVEGVEREALEGAVRALKKSRPKLQVSVYHKETDLLELPLWLIELLPDYSFFLAHHNYYFTETDLYAIPRERLSGNQTMGFKWTERFTTLANRIAGGSPGSPSASLEPASEASGSCVLYRHGLQVLGQVLVTLGVSPQVASGLAHLHQPLTVVRCSTVAEVELFTRSHSQISGIYLWGNSLDDRTERYIKTLRNRFPIFTVDIGPLATPDATNLSPWSMFVAPLGETGRTPASALTQAVNDVLHLIGTDEEEQGRHLDALLKHHGVEQFGFLGLGVESDIETDEQDTILVLDDEPSVRWQGPQQLAFLRKVQADHPNCRLLFRPHPALEELDREVVRQFGIVSQFQPISSLVGRYKRVAVHQDFAGFEALRAGAQVRTYGRPFYAGRGLTEDVEAQPSTAFCKLEALVFIVYSKLALYLHPSEGNGSAAGSKLEELLKRWSEVRSDAERRRILKLLPLSKTKVTAAVSFNVGPKWRPAVERMLPEYKFFYMEKKGYKSTIRELLDEHPDLVAVLWGYFQPPDFEEFAESIKIPIRRFEDGFLRSVGTGRDVDAWGKTNYPLALTLDANGIYYDRRAPSDVELLLKAYPFQQDPWLLERARLCIQRINDLRLTKYNTTSKVSSEDLYGPKDRYRILVVGQVEQDRSIQFGCTTPVTNNDIIRAARRDFPNAQILYKPHPVVLRNFMPSVSDPREVAHICEIVTDEISLPDALVGVDHMYTITSGSGFEALLRGVKVTTFGANFYAGWGLTDDRDPLARRTRRLSLEELFAGFYILHTRYFDHKRNVFISLEDAIEELARGREEQVGVEDFNRALRLEEEGDIYLASCAAQSALQTNTRFPGWHEAAMRIAWKLGEEQLAAESAKHLAQTSRPSALSKFILTRADIIAGQSLTEAERTFHRLTEDEEIRPLALLGIALCRFHRGQDSAAPLVAFSRALDKSMDQEKPPIWAGADGLFWAAVAARSGEQSLCNKLMKQAELAKLSLPLPLFLERENGAPWARTCMNSFRTDLDLTDFSSSSFHLSFDEANQDVRLTSVEGHTLYTFLDRPRLCTTPCVVRQSSLFRPQAGWRDFSYSNPERVVALISLELEQRLTRELDHVPGLLALACSFIATQSTRIVSIAVEPSSTGRLTSDERQILEKKYRVQFTENNLQKSERAHAART